jgi:DNA invertase Pin-like site-specific DNA recombinase
MSMEEDPDIVQVIIQACQSSGLDAAAAHEIELRIRAQYGGLRVRIPKRKKHPTRQERELVVADGVTNMSNEEIMGKHGISRATLYRMMKRGTSGSNG